MTEIYCDICLGACWVGHPANHWDEITAKEAELIVDEQEARL